jgi:hypothetical protein
MEGGMKMIEQRVLRYAAPELYRKMVGIFSIHHIHPYDIQAYAVKTEDGMEITLRFSVDFSQSVTTHVSIGQIENPDDEVINFFEEAAHQCKTMLVADYYKMIKL